MESSSKPNQENGSFITKKDWDAFQLETTLEILLDPQSKMSDDSMRCSVELVGRDFITNRVNRRSICKHPGCPVYETYLTVNNVPHNLWAPRLGNQSSEEPECIRGLRLRKTTTVK